MNLKKIQDTYIKKRDRLSVPSGHPTDLNLLDFREALNSKIYNPSVSTGIAQEESGDYLGLAVRIPASIDIHSLIEPLQLVYTEKKGNELVAYYSPASGWKLSQTKES